MHDLIAQEIRDLVAVGERLAMDASVSEGSLGHDRVQELTTISARGGQLISRLYGPQSHYFSMFQSVVKKPDFNFMHSNNYENVANIVGILKGVQHEVENGLLTSLRSLIQAEIFSDFLEMAEYLLGEGYKDASAVLLGAVLEDSLRKIADSNGIDTFNAKGKPLSIEPLNASLRKNEVYGPLIQKQITSWANLRNDAAHGHHDRYDHDQTKQMLLFVQKFCSDFLR